MLYEGSISRKRKVSRTYGKHEIFFESSSQKIASGKHGNETQCQYGDSLDPVITTGPSLSFNRNHQTHISIVHAQGTYFFCYLYLKQPSSSSSSIVTIHNFQRGIVTIHCGQALAAHSVCFIRGGATHRSVRNIV